MREWESQSHVRWYCRYHVVIVPTLDILSLFIVSALILVMLMRLLY